VDTDVLIPSLTDFDQLRNNFEAYCFFFTNFVSCIVGKSYFKKNIGHRKISEYITVSDEAMTHLILMNNIDVWIEIGNKKKEGNTKMKLENCTSKQRYFSDGKGRGRSWNNEGKNYYNAMYKKIIEDRKTNGDTFDTTMNENLNYNDTDEKRNKMDSNFILGKEQQQIQCFSDIAMGEMLSDNNNIDHNEEADVNEDNV